MSRALLERFWGYVDDSGGPDACWPWRGPQNGDGYGVMWLGRSAHYPHKARAHRLMLDLLGTPVPAGLDVDHRCHNEAAACLGGDACPHRGCVNPAHLEVVTHQVNVCRSRLTVAGKNAAKTHCINGHPLSGDNLRISSSGRKCRACTREASRVRAKTGVAPRGLHGTVSGYSTYGCRCRPCKDAAAAYMRQKRQKQKAAS